MHEGWAAADDRFAHRTLLGREGGRLHRRRPVVSERGPAAAPLRPIPGARRDYSRYVSRFLERLRTGPPLVADGGTGALISEAVPGLRCPEEANLRAPESVVAVH